MYEFEGVDEEVLEEVPENDFVESVRERTLGEKISDAVAEALGTWYFLGGVIAFIVVWATLNTVGPHIFDAYPFILLNLFLSMGAMIFMPIIIMTQNRQLDRDQKRAERDYEVSAAMAQEIHDLHEKIDALVLSLDEKKQIY